MMNAENFGPDETLETKSVGLVYLLQYRYHYLKVSPTRVEYLHSKLNSSDKIIHNLSEVHVPTCFPQSASRIRSPNALT